MPNIAAALKSEITRLARKAIREETSSLKKAIPAYRADIAALKRRIQDLEQQLRRTQKAATKAASPVQADAASSQRRFSAKGLAKHRQRLGLTLKEFGALIGASSLSVNNWELRKGRPRQRYLEAIAAVRTMGKREAAARLNGE